MDSLIDQIKKLSSNADATSRHQISHKLRDVANSIETPRQAVLRHSYLTIQLAVTQTAANLNLYKILADGDGPSRTNAVAEKCGATPELTSRILRFLASVNDIEETSQDTWAANNTTRALADPSATAGITHGFYDVSPVSQELPSFLKSNDYHSPTESTKAPWHVGHKTDLNPFAWLNSQPEKMSNFMAHLPAHVSPVHWTAAVPLVERLGKNRGGGGDSSPPPLFVDIGGGPGNQAVAFKNTVKDAAKGRIINQDLKETLDSAPDHEGVEKMVASFFEEQPVKGATFYYMRQVFHNWPDSKCLEILSKLRPAMSSRSTLLIDEIVIPKEGASTMAATSDVLMMMCFAASERTEAQWKSLLDKAGFEVREIWRYDPEMGYAILEVGVRA